MTTKRYTITLLCVVIFSLASGYMAATRPEGAGWRYFSYHPFLMISGFVGMMTSSAITKKLGGYTNTKLHGMMGFAGLCMAYGGFYVIYQNKNNMGKPHFTSTHAWGGLVCMVGVTVVGLAGGVLLHPDWGIAKTNKSYRALHFWFGRIFIMLGWFACFTGLQQLTTNLITQALLGLPLLLLVPFGIL
eukprot:CAMPEP_0185729780 /NCGR_PEP_ID=MMETSP1171-20130828/7238_1 /TAXON_ID=374046 /ORGANISM="Helicotheca tamensis, Strain CCMP826" /LENGTH=187 /DNA_ID=CAMNT_0028398695 /DNA_START=105 /DNA_END=668 /DNA_ORIENTATION=-